MKTAIVFFILGTGEGMIICDWIRTKTKTEKTNENNKHLRPAKARRA